MKISPAAFRLPFALMLVPLWLPATSPPLEIERATGNVNLTWDGNGILESAGSLNGPWLGDLNATSPFRVPTAGGQQFFRVFYPFGVRSWFEPPIVAPGEPSAIGQAIGAKAAEDNDEAASVHLFSGEFHHAAVDLRIRGRGLDFVWTRHYRSRIGPNTAQGNRWDFSYNISVRRRGPNVEVADGNTRRDVFCPQPDGSYGADQFFREGRFEANEVFKMTFADKGTWEFRSLNEPIAPGRIARIADRNGNALALAYDGIGRLSAVTDTLGRVITIGYNANCYIASVTDFAGRQVRYTYYQNSDANGAAGDLRSAISPAVTGTPTGNDFPLGKTNTYAYTRGFAEAGKNHLLLTITDPKGQTWLKNTYVLSGNVTNLDFLRVQSQRIGNPGEVRRLEYVAQSPPPANGMAVVKTIVNDRVGNVSEHSYDAGNRLVLSRQFTGRAIPGQPTTEALNRPLNPLRTNDPAFFETRGEWNVDSLPTRLVHPNGNSVEHIYELALNPGASRHTRGNLRTHVQLPGPLGGDQTQIVEQFEYDAGFGSCCGGNFVTRHVDGRTNETRHAYDERGNRTNTIHRLPGITEQWEYNAFGQVTAHVLPDNGSGHKRRDAFVYHTSGPQLGYLRQSIVDFASGGLNLMTTYEYDAVGNVVRRVDPRGNDQLTTYNQLDQPVLVQDAVLVSFSGGSPTTVRYTTGFFYDANDNLVLVNRSNYDEANRLYVGNLSWDTSYDYEVLNRLIRATEEVNPTNNVVTEFGYDANRNRTLVRTPEAVNGRQPGNVLQTDYDERNLVFREVNAPGLPEESIDQFDFDGNANLSLVNKIDGFTVKQGVKPHDGFNRPMTLTDAMGNVTTWHYDPNGNVVSERTDGETNDVAGITGNVRLAETTHVYDAMDRRVRSDAAFFDPLTQTSIGDGQSTRLFTYSDASRLLTETDDNNRTTRHVYDRANRPLMITDPKTNTVSYAYDSNGNLISTTQVDQSDSNQPSRTYTMAYTYDALNRLVQQRDNLTNILATAYDSRNNPVLVTNAMGFQTWHSYDGLSRMVSRIVDPNTNGPSPADLGDIVLSQQWDDNGRLISRTDDNTNTTLYAYDALNRLVRTTQADGTTSTNLFDASGNPVWMRDANGTEVTAVFDLLDRITNKFIVPASGVSTQTTFEQFIYDGQSRLVRAVDNDTTNTFAWDSLGSLARETFNGAVVVATHDGAGNMLTRTYPGGRQLSYLYDGLNRATRVNEGGNDIATHLFIGPGSLERREYGNRTSTDYFYDGASGVPNAPGDFGWDRPARIRHQLVAAFDERTFSWDRNENRTARTDALPGGLTHQYSYDSADRLARTRVLHPTIGVLRDTMYTLDGAGNRTITIDGAHTEIYGRDATLPEPADFQVNQYSTTPFDSRVYDAKGNPSNFVAGRNLQLLVFDYRDQLVSHNDVGSQQLTTFAYDPLGRRTRKTVTVGTGAPQVTRYIWSGGELIEERNAADATLATYVHAGGELLQMRRGAADYFYHTDGLGNVFALTDALGAVVERYDYDDFGRPQFFSGAGASIPQSAVGNPYLFNGRRHDPETGFYGRGVLKSTDSGASWSTTFDPSAGRWLTRSQPDSAGNAYSFAGNNPWSPNSMDWPPIHNPTGADVAGGSPQAGQATGKRQHMPIRFRSYYDQSLDGSSGNLTLGAGAATSQTCLPIAFPCAMCPGGIEYRMVCGGSGGGRADGWIEVGGGAQWVHFNPKELSIAKPVPWQKSGGNGPSSIGYQTTSPASVRHRAFFIVDRTNLDRAAAQTCLPFPYPCPTCPGGINIKWVCSGSDGGSNEDLIYTTIGAQVYGPAGGKTLTGGMNPQAGQTCLPIAFPCATCPGGIKYRMVCGGGGGGGGGGGRGRATLLLFMYVGAGP